MPQPRAGVGEAVIRITLTTICGGIITPIDLGIATTSSSATAISSTALLTGNYRVAGDPLTHGYIRAAARTVMTGIEYPEAVIRHSLLRD